MSSIPYITLADRNNVASMPAKPVPALLLEGIEDYQFYGTLFRTCPGPFDVVVAGTEKDGGGGKNKILSHHRSGSSKFKYVAILDRDFDGFRSALELSDDIKYTHHYSVESYLVNYGLLISELSTFCTWGQDPDRIVTPLVRQLLDGMAPAAAVCRLKLINGWGFALERESILKWYEPFSLTVKEQDLKSYVSAQVPGLRTWPPSYARCRKDYLACPDDQKLDQIPGKWLVTALFHGLKCRYPQAMKMTQEAFELHLARRLPQVTECVDLVRAVSDRLQGHRSA